MTFLEEPPNLIEAKMKNKIPTLIANEYKNYFRTPLGFILLIIFALLTNFLTFYAGGFLIREKADLLAFFLFHPWIYIFIIPAISMKLWSEERKTGTIEILLTMPISTTETVISKFLSAWAFCLTAMLTSVPLLITVNILGTPDNGVIISSYIASLFMAGAFLAISLTFSAMTSSQISAYLASSFGCMIILISGIKPIIVFISHLTPQLTIKAIESLSFISHFTSITQGIFDINDFIYFTSTIIIWLILNIAVLEVKKEG